MHLQKADALDLGEGVSFFVKLIITEETETKVCGANW